MISKTILLEGIRIFLSDLKRKAKGNRAYFGNDEKICKKIIDSCWNEKNKFFCVSNGHFCQFYCRDFGWTIESLIHLGKKDKVLQTLKYAISKFESQGKITVAITPNGVPYDFPDEPSIDSVAYFFRCLRIAGTKELVKNHKTFLEGELLRIESYLTKDGLVNPNINFSGMRDYAIRKSSCYDNVFAAMLCKEADLLGLKNPLKKFDFEKTIMKYFWNGKYFNDDLDDVGFSSDANIYPFLFEVIQDKNKKMLKSIVLEIEKRKLNTPFPLKYTDNRDSKMIFFEFIVKNWEKDCIWAHMGLAYIELVSKINKTKAKKLLQQYKSKIEENKNFIEVYFPNGKQYKSFFYLADEGMLWAANYLRLKEEIKFKIT